MSRPNSKLFYIHDPMCSWCWAFAPLWRDIQSQLSADIECCLLVGGLAPDSDQPMPQAMREKLQLTWQTIQQVVPGTPFNFDFWTACEPRRSTYPSCRAVIAARTLDSALETPMIQAIQKAYYLEAQNPSDAATLIRLAESIGADRDQFTYLLSSEAVEARFQQELAFARQLGIQGFPSLVLQTGEQHFHGIAINFEDTEAVTQQISLLTSQAEKSQGE